MKKKTCLISFFVAWTKKQKIPTIRSLLGAPAPPRQTGSPVLSVPPFFMRINRFAGKQWGMRKKPNHMSHDELADRFTTLSVHDRYTKTRWWYQVLLDGLRQTTQIRERKRRGGFWPQWYTKPTFRRLGKKSKSKSIGDRSFTQRTRTRENKACVKRGIMPARIKRMYVNFAQNICVCMCVCVCVCLSVCLSV